MTIEEQKTLIILTNGIEDFIIHCNSFFLDQKIEHGLIISAFAAVPEVTSMDGVDFQFHPPVFKKLQQFKNFDVDCPTGNLNDLNWNDIIDNSVICGKCARTSTVFYPLNFKSMTTAETRKKVYGRSLLGDNYHHVCTDCCNYMLDGNAIWQNAWPSVLYTVCFAKKGPKNLKYHESLLRLLPYQLQASWLLHAKSVFAIIEITPLFRDMTRNMKHFQQLISTRKGNDYIKAMNRYCHPSIRCFCGASTYIDSFGTVPFQHVLNYLDSAFVSFGASYRKKLLALRNDYFRLCDTGIVFELRPSVTVDSQGLVLLTCLHHDSGSSKKMVHVPRHPLVGNLSHPHADRLASVASSFREATPMKMGEFSHTWSMSKSVHGKDGAGSLVLHCERSFCVKSQSLLPAIESVFLNNRNDMIENVAQIAQEHFLPQSIVRSLLRKYEAPKLVECLESATVIPQSTINQLKKYYETTKKIDTKLQKYKKLCVVSIPTYNGRPIFSYPSKEFVKIDATLSIIIFLFSNFPELSNTILINERHQTLDKLLELVLETTVNRRNKTILQELHRTFYGELHLSSTSDCSTVLSTLWRALNNPVFSAVPSLDKLFDVEESAQLILVAPLNTTKNISEPFNSPKDNSTFSLIAIDGSMVGTGNFFYSFEGIFWNIDLLTQKAELSTCPPKTRRLKYAIFVRSKQHDCPVYGLPTEIEKVKCPEHAKPFCVEVSQQNFLCSFDVACQCKVLYRCPINDCGFSLCKKHHNAMIENPSNLSVREAAAGMFDAPAGSVSSALHLDTDAGSTSLPVEHSDCLGGGIVSMHALLNELSTVLLRSQPIEASRKLKRFLQRFLCLHPSSSSSLVQLEALIFPSIFYYQFHDGSYPGAIPFFLYSDEKDCSQFGYDSLLLHFRTRLTDPTLLTSSNAKYIQFAADCLLNLNLRGKHTKSFIKRGLQSVELDKDLPRFEKACNNFSSDTEMRVDELSSAMRSHPVTLFVTLSCNQKGHPGVAPLKEAIDENFKGATDEERLSAAQAYMPVFVRNWSRAIKYLIDLLIHSSERLLGEILKLWGRAEFQTLAGNLPHYHFLIWLVENSVDKFNLVQCCEKHILHALLKIADSSLELIEDEVHLYKLYDECVRFHSHNCDLHDGRCKKRKDLEGNKICRSPAFPPSHVHWVMPIETQYPNEALKVLEKLDLAERIPGTLFGLRPKGALKTEKIMYAATKGEHILPTSALLHCITRSSTNVLLTTQRFSSSYLSSYTTKTEEHSDGRIVPTQDGKSFRLRTEGIQNKFLASVKILNKLDRLTERHAEKIDCRLVSLTESVFWTLGLPYVITTMDFVHVQNVPPELRYVPQRKFNSGFEEKYLVFRDKLQNLEDFQKLTDSQKTMAIDLQSSGQADDQMSSFSIRPPELLCVNKVELFCSWFIYEKKRIPTSDLVVLFQHQYFKPWINARGWQVKLRPSAFEDFRNFLYSQSEPHYVEAVRYNLQLLASCEVHYTVRSCFIADGSNISKTNAEVVFASVNPRKLVNFLVSFLLRFGSFETELELFHCDELLESYIVGKLVSRNETYSEADLWQLLDIYVRNELMYLPGGSISFSSKLLTAKRAFSTILKLETGDFLETPVVLISDMRERVNKIVDSFFDSRLKLIFTSLQRLGIPNLPESMETVNSMPLWKPVITFDKNQTPQSKNEQSAVLSQLIKAVNGILTTRSPTMKNNHLVIG